MTDPLDPSIIDAGIEAYDHATRTGPDTPEHVIGEVAKAVIERHQAIERAKETQSDGNAMCGASTQQPNTGTRHSHASLNGHSGE